MNIPTEIDPETLPDHEPDRFNNFFEILIDGKPAFKLLDGSTFFLDSNNGWIDEKNCYYDSQGKPAGWYKTFDDQTYFYNSEGFFIPYDKDPSTLPKHNEQVNINKLDTDQNFLDTNGCYYDKFGEALGWKLKCEDGQIYFFDLKGEYVDLNTREVQNDLNEFDFGDFKQNFKQKTQFVKQQQKTYPKVEPRRIKDQPQKQNRQQVKNQQISKPQQQQQSQNRQNNQKAIYHYELPDLDETKKLFIALVKQKLQSKAEFLLNDQLLTVKCDEPNKGLEQDFNLENGKCVTYKNDINPKSIKK
ncbi:unnamed protein product [Paramecium sonneborni]|uniref:Uncharacterized protein n=1 Tax=Paramecium sonneborni TaxID=65129 RepID=A0A8S1PSR9_9CILI|nr:unnamed protein product [Paramecium sonneborni]